MTLPPLNTPIPHDGSATCPVHPETLVTVTFIDGKKAEKKIAGWWVWSKITTYTIIARAPADEIAALQARVTELEGALREIIATDHHNFYDGPPPQYVRIARAALKGNPNAHD